jgi:hypothetical protein
MSFIGRYHTLRIARETKFGVYLDLPGTDGVLLPGKYVPATLKVGDEVEVFLYKDSEERLVATTLRPYLTLGEFAGLEAAIVNDTGAFMKWGLEKDLFVPFREQPVKMVTGRRYLIYLYLDDRTNRLVGTAHIQRYLDLDPSELEPDQEVEVIFWEPTELGWQVVVNNRFKGLVYKSEIFTEVYPGLRKKAFVKKVREDLKLDLALQRAGRDLIEPGAAAILNALKAAGGFLPLHDKSEPAEIARHFEMSKKAFKKAVGLLYREKKILVQDDGIRLV